MSDVINIFNPKDQPFGWLSNNYIYQMRLDSKEWFTVTNYIYANLLRTPTYQVEVQGVPAKDARDRFEKLFKQESDNVISKSCRRALVEKFDPEKYTQLAQLLIDTGDAPIYYISPDTLLGMGQHEDGENLYGKFLMQTRHALKITFQQKKHDMAVEERDQRIYDTYLAQKALTNMMEKGNDITEFAGLSAAEIVNRLGRTHSSQMQMGDEKKTIVNVSEVLPPNVFGVVTTRDNVLEMAHRGYLSDTMRFVDNPENMVPQIRKDYIAKLRLIRIKQRNQTIFDMYADYILRKRFTIPRNQYKQAKEEQLDSLSWTEKNNLEIRLYNCYTKGGLSENLSQDIDTFIAGFPIPTEDDVKEVENVPITYGTKETEVVSRYVPTSGTPIHVYPTDFEGMDQKYAAYVQFSPFSYTGVLRVDNFSFPFPNVILYIYANLLANIPLEKNGEGVGNLSNAVKYIQIDPNLPPSIDNFLGIDLVKTKYDNLLNISLATRLRNYATIGMDAKFRNREAQDVLLMTGDAKLVYTDYKDSVLGVGPKGVNGEDFVGKYLMVLRQRIREERKGETLGDLKTVEVDMLIQQDPKMKVWITMRVKDMCRVLSLMKNYLWAKDEIVVVIDENFASTVLDRIYQPCTYVYAAVGNITADVPYFFRNIVTSCKGFNKIGRDVVQVLWQRIAVMLYYLMQYLKASDVKNAMVIIAAIEDMVSKDRKCVKIMQDEYDNCIASAILNLLRGMYEFNTRFSYKNLITERDVKTASSIILNADVTDEIPPVVPKTKVTVQTEENLPFDIANFGLDEEGRLPPTEEDELAAELQAAILEEDNNESNTESQATTLKPPGIRKYKERVVIDSDNTDIDIEEYTDILPKPKGNKVLRLGTSEEYVYGRMKAASDYDVGPVKYGKTRDKKLVPVEEVVEYQEDFYMPSKDMFSQAGDVPEEEDVLDYEGYAAETSLLVAKLRKMEGIENPLDIAQLIESAINTIKTYPISNKVKTNRINFFATQR